MTAIEQQKAAKQFAEQWASKGYEKGESQPFWLELLSTIFGIANPADFIYFEQQVKIDHTAFIDAIIPSTHVMIEQKSLEKDLGSPIKQSDGTLLTPFQQAKRYSSELPYSQRPRWIVTCNFAEFWVYDMEQPNGEPQKILLKDLEKEYYRLQFLVDAGDEHIKREMEVSVKAGELVGKMYDLLLEQYKRGLHRTAGTETLQSHQKDEEEIFRSLNILCVRLVFCLYAEDAGVFHNRTAFYDYLKPYRAVDIRSALQRLFDVLDTPITERDPYLEDDLRIFPYVNGGLFGKRDRNIVIPPFNEALRNLLLQDMSSYFDWSEISPTIFGAVFESTLNPETRRRGGMHYTSIENIHKVIDPLFLDGLKSEFERIVGQRGDNTLLSTSQRRALTDFQNKLASLTFFDPACGSGNFLTETYLSLRRLENMVIQAMSGGENMLTFDCLIKVNISQFYGIEINDFAVSVAKTALWIAENQMLRETSVIAGKVIDFLPLKTNAYIHEGNALRIDWAELFVSQDDISYHYPDYIIGNPPFVGARLMSSEQKEDLLTIFGKHWKNIGNIDYVAGWYLKTAAMMKKSISTASESNRVSPIRVALVSTNSITQGEQVAILWKPLFEQYGIHFDFAYRTFRWDSEADIKAHVHCVIIGFSYGTRSSSPAQNTDNADEDIRTPRIYLSNNQSVQASNINAYLMDAPNVWIESRTKPLCEVPEIGIGNKPIDGGFYLFTEGEKDEFIRQEPKSASYFRPWYGAEEFINNKKRYCLWLGDCSPAELRSMPLCYERVMNVREYRLKSPSAGTVKLADKPTRFHVENMPKSTYIIIPETSSERRRYVPMGFMTPDVLCSNAVRLIPNATLYHFGVLTSNVHMAWMRVVCGRLEMRYRYSKDIVYNNFPWPNIIMNSRDLKDLKVSNDLIAQTAQAILDARTKYPDCSLADLYDEVTMPPELRKAHQDNDRAVMAAYGFDWRTMTESDCVTELFKLYRHLTNKK